MCSNACLKIKSARRLFQHSLTHGIQIPQGHTCEFPKVLTCCNVVKAVIPAGFVEVDFNTFSVQAQYYHIHSVHLKPFPSLY